jgi:hypothetical protein
MCNQRKHKKDLNGPRIHLTEKPVELAARAMEYSSKRGENVAVFVVAAAGDGPVGRQKGEEKEARND